MKLNDILNMNVDDVMKLTKEELQPIVTQIGKNVYQRKYRIEHDVTLGSSHATSMLRGNIKSGKNLSLNELRSEFTRGVNFLKSPTSLISGAKESNDKLKDTLGLPDDTPIDIIKKTWEILNEISESYPSVVAGLTTTDLFDLIQKEVVKGNTNIYDIIQKIDDKYEEIQEENDTDFFVDGYDVGGSDEF